MDRILRHVLERVVHPAHVPLEAESEPAGVRRAGYQRPRGRFLGHHHDAGVLRVDARIQVLQKADGVQVLVPAAGVRNPFAGLAPVVEIEHRGDRVHPQPVEVVLLEPEEGAGDEEVADLAAAVVEDQRAPVGMLPLPRVRVLVETGAVEAGQTVGVLREVCGRPVHEDADAAPVQRIHQLHELLRRSETARRREVAERPVAPGLVERVFGDGQQLDVREAELRDVVGQPAGDVAVGQPAACAGDAHPRAQVHLVDRDRGVVRIAGRTRGHPVAVAPGVARQIPDPRRGAGAQLGGERVRVGLLHGSADSRRDLVLVERAAPDPRDERLPDPRLGSQPHRVRRRVPRVEVADDGNVAGVGRPDGEVHAVGAVLSREVRAELVVAAVVGAAGEEMEVVVGEKR